MSFTERKAIRLVAYFEAFKGMLVLVAASGLLTLLHRNVQDFAARLIEHAHLNPASKYPRIFLDAAGQLQDSRLVMLALGAAAYSALRLVEAYGLYREKAWAEVLAAASGAVYMPLELYGWVRDPTWLHACIFVLNAAVVAVMLLALIHRRQTKPRRPAPATASGPGSETGKAL